MCNYLCYENNCPEDLLPGSICSVLQPLPPLGRLSLPHLLLPFLFYCQPFPNMSAMCGKTSNTTPQTHSPCSSCSVEPCPDSYSQLSRQGCPRPQPRSSRTHSDPPQGHVPATITPCLSGIPFFLSREAPWASSSSSVNQHQWLVNWSHILCF